jgi:hypothetical protein
MVLSRVNRQLKAKRRKRQEARLAAAPCTPALAKEKTPVKGGAKS